MTADELISELEAIKYLYGGASTILFETSYEDPNSEEGYSTLWDEIEKVSYTGHFVFITGKKYFDNID